ERSTAISQRRLNFSVAIRAPGDSTMAGSISAPANNAAESIRSAMSISVMPRSQTAAVVFLLIAGPRRLSGFVGPVDWPAWSMTCHRHHSTLRSVPLLAGGRHMAQRPWLSTYGERIPREIDPNAFRSVVHLFEHAFQRYPDKPAFRCFGQTLT